MSELETNAFIDFIQDIENEKEQLDFKVDNMLRKRGWESSSSHPGSLWLWTKTHNGLTYSVPKQTAIHMEMNLWSWEKEKPKKKRRAV